MTLIDVAALVLLVLYALIGFYTGLIRRVIGLVAVYVGTLVGTYMGPPGGSIIQQVAPGTPMTDARLYAWLGFFLLILVIFEFFAALLRRAVQISVIAFNRGTGFVVGLATALVVISALTFIGAGFAQPLGSGELDTRQLQVRDGLSHSAVALPLAQQVAPYILPLLQGALPRDPHTYFGAANP